MRGYRSILVRSMYAIAIGLCLVGPSRADNFPSRPIKIIVGFGPGGIGDTTARLVAQKMSESLGSAVYIENIPGASGITAAASAARAQPDGHTILLVSGQNAVAPLLFKSLPYDPAGFAMVSTVGIFDFLMVVHKDSPLKTTADVIALAKKDPTHFNIGTISAGSIQNLSALLFASMAGLSVPTVPFRTTGDVIAALMSDQIQVGFETLPGVIGQVQSGNLRAIAVGSEHRMSLMPDVPTVMESGLPGYRSFSWNGFVVPARTPPEIVRRLNLEVTKAVNDPELHNRFAELGVVPHASTPAEMQVVYDDDASRWRDIIISAKLRQQ